eukprot:2842446-Rhodomonas_salina.3
MQKIDFVVASTTVSSQKNEDEDEDEDPATREDSPLSDASKGQGRTCQWREEGWSEGLELSCDWFSHNISAWERVFKHLGWLEAAPCCSQGGSNSDQNRGRRTVLEIGVWEGNSAAWLLQHVVGSGVLLCVDSFRGGEEHCGEDFTSIEARFRQNMQTALSSMQPTSAQVLLLKGLASQVLPALLCGDGKWERLQGESGMWEPVDAQDASASVNKSLPSDSNTPCTSSASSPRLNTAIELDVVYIDGSYAHPTVNFLRSQY